LKFDFKGTGDLKVERVSRGTGDLKFERSTLSCKVHHSRFFRAAQTNGGQDRMNKWLRRLRGVVGMGVAWGVIWAVGGLLIGVASNLLPFLPWHYFFSVWDALALPGFLGGCLFAGVVAAAAKRDRFDELSLPRVAAWGAVGGLLVSLIPPAMGAVGLVHLREGLSMGAVWAVVAPPLVLLSAASAAVSLLLARIAEGRVEDADEDAESLLLSPGEPTVYRASARSRDREL